MGEKRRIFIALPISDEIKKEAMSFQDHFPEAKIIWLSYNDLHITLIPPWHEENVDKIISLLKTLEGKIGSFEFEFKKITYGPNLRRPRLIWAEGAAPEGLFKLKTSLKTLLKDENIIREFEKRNFRMHMTLARFKEYDFIKFPIKKLFQKISWKQKSTSIVLMETKPDGENRYKILQEIKI